MCTQQSRKVIWDMISTLFPVTVAVEPTFVAVLYSTRKHVPVASHAILSNFFKEQCTQNHPQYLRDCRVHFFLSQKSCKQRGALGSIKNQKTALKMTQNKKRIKTIKTEDLHSLIFTKSQSRSQTLVICGTCRLNYITSSFQMLISSQYRHYRWMLWS